MLYLKLALGIALKIEPAYRLASMNNEHLAVTPTKARLNHQAFEQVFKDYFKALHGYAMAILKDSDEAEEMVQQVFFKLWDRGHLLPVEGSVAAYLYRAVHNECMNYLRHQQVKLQHQLHVVHRMKNEHEQIAVSRATELEQQYRQALNDLPEQCRTVFQLSRFENLKYREIADKLDISVKTVENHMGKALKLLRSRLADFLTLLILLFHQ